MIFLATLYIKDKKYDKLLITDEILFAINSISDYGGQKQYDVIKYLLLLCVIDVNYNPIDINKYCDKLFSMVHYHFDKIIRIIVSLYKKKKYMPLNIDLINNRLNVVVVIEKC